MSIKLNTYLLYWYFQHNQCLNINKTRRTKHTYISMVPYARGTPGQLPSAACPCAKTALNSGAPEGKQLLHQLWHPLCYVTLVTNRMTSNE